MNGLCTETNPNRYEMGQIDEIPKLNLDSRKEYTPY